MSSLADAAAAPGVSASSGAGSSDLRRARLPALARADKPESPTAYRDSAAPSPVDDVGSKPTPGPAPGGPAPMVGVGLGAVGPGMTGLLLALAGTAPGAVGAGMAPPGAGAAAVAKGVPTDTGIATAAAPAATPAAATAGTTSRAGVSDTAS